MTIGDLKNRIADYLQVSFRPTGEDSNDPAVLAKMDELALLALNNARKVAERTHDFLAAEVRAQVSVSPSGGDLSGALLWVPGVTPSVSVDVKNIFGGYLLSDDGKLANAIDVLSRSRTWTELREQQQAGIVERYPGDVTGGNYDRCTYLYEENDVLYFYPEQTDTIDIVLDVSRWMPEYTDDGDEDWFTKHGSDYMMWAGIMETNYLFQTFVPRQEGGVSPPSSPRDRALQQLIVLDGDRRTSGRINDQY